MNSFRQIWAVTKVNLMSLPQRLGSSSVVVFGNAGVVAVLVSVLAMAAGFQRTVAETGRADRAIVMRGGSNSELTSVLTRDVVQKIDDAPGVKWNGTSQPVASAELVMVAALTPKGSTTRLNVTLRGIGLAAAALRPEVHVTEGRMFEPGRQEIVVGHAVQKQFPELAVGRSILFGNSEWQVVGTFESGGDSHESEVLGDVVNVADTFRRRSFNSVTVLLNDASAFDGFASALVADPALSVDVVREVDYFLGLSEHLSHLLTVVGWLVGGIMSIGAVFGALNTINAAVGSRRIEIATLRAMGFNSTSIVVSVVVEALILAMLGGLVGSLVAWGVFNGNAINTLGSNYAQVIFRLVITPGLIGLGLGLTLVIGLIGGLVPAARTAWQPVAVALRSL